MSALLCFVSRVFGERFKSKTLHSYLRKSKFADLRYGSEETEIFAVILYNSGIKDNVA